MSDVEDEYAIGRAQAVKTIWRQYRKTVSKAARLDRAWPERVEQAEHAWRHAEALLERAKQLVAEGTSDDQ